jgi:uncharacterized protein YciI
MKRYLVLAMRTPGFDPAVVAPHRAFLEELRARGCLEMTGGFSDGSGGAYVLLAEHADAARAIVLADPLHTSGASMLTFHEWNA